MTTTKGQHATELPLEIFGNIDIVSTSFTKSANNAAGQSPIESYQDVECNADGDNDRRRGANVYLIASPAINDWGYQR